MPPKNKKEQNDVICRKIGETRDHQVKQNEQTWESITGSLSYVETRFKRKRHDSVRGTVREGGRDGKQEGREEDK
jgi:hypothetical protein